LIASFHKACGSLHTGICLCCFLQEVLKGLIGFLDIVGIYFALTQLQYRNISQNHKFQAVGLGEKKRLGPFVSRAWMASIDFETMASKGLQKLIMIIITLRKLDYLSVLPSYIQETGPPICTLARLREHQELSILCETCTRGSRGPFVFTSQPEFSALAASSVTAPGRYQVATKVD
jgi:hypothetical protein